ncbi:Ubiquitin Carboxyl-Terminal Hydrolase 11 [Manis pentadactyla]|nr:Ubiquitin Carboxyl-Terminal Hydrolase 11 [Manis pentadactyla]
MLSRKNVLVDVMCIQFIRNAFKPLQETLASKNKGTQQQLCTYRATGVSPEQKLISAIFPTLDIILLFYQESL